MKSLHRIPPTLALTDEEHAALGQLPVDALVKEIKTYIDQGDKAKAESDEHYLAAGKRLLKLKLSRSKAEFEKVVREQVGIGISRAYQLAAVAAGHVTFSQLRERNRAANKKLRDRQAGTSRDGQHQQDDDHQQEGGDEDLAGKKRRQRKGEIQPPSFKLLQDLSRLCDKTEREWKQLYKENPHADIDMADDTAQAVSHALNLAMALAECIGMEAGLVEAADAATAAGREPMKTRKRGLLDETGTTGADT